MLTAVAHVRSYDSGLVGAEARAPVSRQQHMQLDLAETQGTVTLTSSSAVKSTLPALLETLADAP